MLVASVGENRDGRIYTQKSLDIFASLMTPAARVLGRDTESWNIVALATEPQVEEGKLSIRLRRFSTFPSGEGFLCLSCTGIMDLTSRVVTPISDAMFFLAGETNFPLAEVVRG